LSLAAVTVIGALIAATIGTWLAFRGVIAWRFVVVVITYAVAVTPAVGILWNNLLDFASNTLHANWLWLQIPSDSIADKLLSTISSLFALFYIISEFVEALEANMKRPRA
jgi:hypothetical protein